MERIVREDGWRRARNLAGVRASAFQDGTPCNADRTKDDRFYHCGEEICCFCGVPRANHRRRYRHVEHQTSSLSVV